MSFKMALHTSLHVHAYIEYISFVIFKYDASKKKVFHFCDFLPPGMLRHISVLVHLIPQQ